MYTNFIRLLIFFLGSFHFVIAQELPKVISTSPQAAAFLRYGEIPVDFSTGVPKIEIPLYTLKASFVEIPISISYHASGIKVTDVPTPVGLGWVLNAGGAVSRTVIGKLDESWKEYSSTNLPPSPRSEEEMNVFVNNSMGNEKYNSYAYGSYDKFSDKYSYFTGSFSGSFRLEYSTNKPVSVPYNSNIIRLNDIQKIIEIVDNSGNNWIFGEKEYSYTQGSTDVYQPTSWYLTKIINASKTDSITLEYIEDLTGGIWIEHRTHSYYGCWGCDRHTSPPICSNCFNPNDPLPEYGYHSNLYTNRIKSKFLQQIKHKGTIIKFSYSIDPSGRFSVLDSFSVYNPQNKIVKSIQLHHTYFGTGDNTRTRLDKISNNDPVTKTEIENHKFAYINNYQELPKYIEHNNRSSSDWLNYKCSEDFWGYYRGYSSPTGSASYSSIPRFPGQQLVDGTDYSTIYSSDRMPKEDYAKTNTIESIEYPTGGKTFFEFQSNYAPYGSKPYSFSEDTILGGLRVKRIINLLDNGDTAIIKEYKYFYPQYQNISVNSYRRDFWLSGAYQCNVINGDACNLWGAKSRPFTSLEDSPVKPITNGNGSIVYYLKVEETLKGKKGLLNGKIIYKYDNPNEGDYSLFYSDSQLQSFSITNYDQGSYSPLLVSKDYFKYENGSFDTVYREIQEYKKLSKGEFKTGLEVEFSSRCTGNCFPYTDPNYFEETKAVRDLIVLAAQKRIDLVKNYGKITSLSTYEYDDSTQLKQKAIYSSSDKLVKTSFKYPYDFKSQAPFNEMSNRNILSPVIEQIDSLNGIFLKSVKTNYRSWSSNLYAPETVFTKIGNSNFESRIRYYGYDNQGNILDVSKENDVRTSYFWGYNQMYPVAKVDNETYTTLSSNATLMNYINQLQNYSDLTASNVRNNLRSLNTNIRNNLPVHTMITTYTYAPLVGVTSETDPNGLTTYYEYDSLGRLKLIRDNDGNIIKTYEYHYKE